MSRYYRRNQSTTRRVDLREDVRCPQCEAPMVLRDSKRGPFYGCSKYPKCRGTRPHESESEGNQENRSLPPIKGSEEQQSIWQEIKESNSHLLVEAGAGTGKTTTVVYGLSFVPEGHKAGFVAFNAHIARELKDKVPSGIKACTLHSLGNAAIHAAYPYAKVDDKGEKLDSIVSELTGHIENFPYDAACKIVSMCKAVLSDGRDANEIDRIVDRYNIEINGDETREALYKSIAPILDECQKRLSMIDFDDMIWLPVVLKLHVEQFDVLFIDECQDLNKSQMELALMACPHGRIIVVGDRFQSIYGFRGADTHAIPNMETRLSATSRKLTTLPLMVCRRCPRSVVALAQKIVPALTALEDAPHGSILQVQDEAANDMMRPGDMILCRTNAPLISEAYRLVRRHIPVKVVGRDIGKGMQTLIKKLKAHSINDLLNKLEGYRQRETSRILAKNPKGGGALVALDDRVDCIGLLCEGIDDLTALRTKIDDLFADFDVSGLPKDKVILSSIHKAKGLESGRVFILRPDLLPHPAASGPEDEEQEKHLIYVAVTRTRFERGNSHTGQLVFVGGVPEIFK